MSSHRAFCRLILMLSLLLSIQFNLLKLPIVLLNIIARIIFPDIPPVFDKRPVTIDILPDDVLLHVFHFHRIWHQMRSRSWKWHRLVHVCRRWRSVVFASPNFLQLRLVCDPKTRRVELTGVWPPVPIIVKDRPDLTLPEDFDFDAAIVHPNRVCEIKIRKIKRAQLRRLVSAMQTKFPALVHLKLYYLSCDRRGHPALTRRFLGGYAPHLQSLMLASIALPPKLLLTFTGLVRLSLWNIPYSGLIFPKALVSFLAAASNLKFLTFEFWFYLHSSDLKRLRPPPLTRTVLPALTNFKFGGAIEYLENLVARIDAPLLDTISITKKCESDAPQLTQFMGRTKTNWALNEVRVLLHHWSPEVISCPPERTIDQMPRLTISRRDEDWQLPSVPSPVTALTSFFPFIHIVENVYIRFNGPQYERWRRTEDLWNARWMEIFRLFTAVKHLYVCKEFAEFYAFAWTLREVVEGRVENMFPALESLFLEERQPSEPVEEAIEQFVATRQLLGHPVAVSHWDMA